MEIQATTYDAYRLVHEGILAFARAERQGIRIDVEYCDKKKKHLSRKVNHLYMKLRETDLYKTWYKVYGTKLNTESNHQLAYILYTVMKMDSPKKTKSGKGSTDEETLQQLNVSGLDKILEIRKLLKVRDTYLNAFLKEQVHGYIHPFFNLHTVRTYRSSSDRPNFQNIPKRDEQAMKTCRRAIFPRPGRQLLEVDYSGLEFNINACYSLDPEMIEYCKDPYSDPHTDVAKKAFLIDVFDKKIEGHSTMRSAGKNAFVFPQVYGDYYKNCAINLACKWAGLKSSGTWKKGQGIKFENGYISDHLISKGIKSLDDFTEHIRLIEKWFFEKFPDHKKYMDNTCSKYQKTGLINILTGFTCRGIMSKNQVLNYPVQGAGFHCLLWSFIELDRIMRQENWNTKLIGQIHDAIIFDVDPDELEHVGKTIHRVTCRDLPNEWSWIAVPLEVEADLCPVDGSWNTKQEYKLPEVK